jgi:restriction system protein
VTAHKMQGAGQAWRSRWPRLPWWTTGTACAVLGYALLHEVAGPDVAAAPAALNRATSWRLAAHWGQYLLPLLIAVWTLVQQVRRGRSILGSTAEQGEVDAPLAMGWREFEVALFGALQRQGYQEVGTSKSRPEVGADRTLRKDRQTVLVRSRHWKDDKVTAEMVHAHCEAMSASGATGGIIVTSGRFGREAIAFGQMHNVKLIDGAILRGLLKQR